MYINVKSDTDNMIMERLSGFLPEEDLRSSLLKLFADRLNTIPCHVEFSRKITPVKEYCRRVNFLFRDNIPEAANQFNRLIDEINSGGYCQPYYSDHRDPLCTMIGTGLDLRENNEMSSLRFWSSSSRKNKISLKMDNKIDGVDSFLKKRFTSLFKKGFLTGYDFYFNGNLKEKLYFNWHYEMGRNNKKAIEKYIDKKILYSFSFCNNIYIRIRENNRVFIYFFNNDISRLLNFLNIDNLPVSIEYNELYPYMIGAYQDEILSGSLKSFNLYYLL